MSFSHLFSFEVRFCYYLVQFLLFFIILSIIVVLHPLSLAMCFIVRYCFLYALWLKLYVSSLWIVELYAGILSVVN